MQIGYVGWVVLLTVLVVTLFVMRRVGQSLEKNPPTESPKDKKRQAVVLTGLILVPVFGFLGVSEFRTYRNLVAIQQHGQRAEAVVDSFYRVCGRGPCSLFVRYHYTAPSPSDRQPIRYDGNKYLSSTRPDDPSYVYANTRGRVPVAYDLNNPQNSAVDFDDSVFTGAQERGQIEMAKRNFSATLIAIGMMSLVMCFFWLVQKFTKAENA